MSARGPQKGALSVAMTLALCGCYEPEVIDCVVACTGPDDCAEAQVCAPDGFCVAPEHAGACEGAVAGDVTAPDAAVVSPPIDASRTDPVDAASDDDEDVPLQTLRVIVEGRGRVVGAPLAISCDGAMNAPGDCSYEIPRGAVVELVAVELHHQWSFSEWDAAGCDDAGSCSVAVSGATAVVARFDRE